jgi:predicted Zn-dependent protease
MPVTAFPWWSAQGDSTSLRLVQKRADSLTSRSIDPVVRSHARYVQASTSAYLELARQDTARAIQHFLALPQDLCPSCFLDRLTLAQLLIDSQRHQDAWKILQADHPTQTLAPEATAVLWSLLRGRVAERLGKRETAVQAYQWVTGMWRRPDPELQSYADEAREGLARLTAEKK